MPTGHNGSLDHVLQFMRLMWEIDHELQSVSKRMVRSRGLTGPQRLALLLVGRRPGISGGELAELLHLHPSTLTGIIGRLVRSGLLRRDWSADDGRRMRLTLTARGRVANRRRKGTVESAVRATVAALPQNDIDAAGRVLARLALQLRNTDDR